MESHNEIVERLLLEYNTDLIPKNDIDSHAEVFDKHPVTAMNDIEPNNMDRILIIADSWKPEWCRDGVQVPVNTIDEQKQPIIRPFDHHIKTESKFVMPDKLIRSTKKHQFDIDKHHRVYEVREMLYEIDPIDCSWIDVTNTERQCLGAPLITKYMIEVTFEMLESLCYKRIRTKIREAETEFLEHDENAKCDVCQSPEGEDGNELVFCEDCFICVHQACYGIPELPSGSWICRHCDKCPNISSSCVLCPNRGGAMKPVENEEDKWAHLSCAVWIPEVGFGNIDIMEPITRLNTIPQARWNLRCHLCKTSGTGAPIQCSERKCKQAFHITCAIQNNLLMKQEVQTNNDVKLMAYCKVHTKKYVEPNSSENDVIQGPRDMIELRIQKQKELEQTFHKFATIDDLKNPPLDQSKHLLMNVENIPPDIKEKIYTYWQLKRTSNHYLCLIKPPSVWSEEHQQQRFNNRSILNAFCKIRFGLDRARLVVDMMVRREKKKAQLFNVMSKISQLQLQQLKSSHQNPLLKDDPSLAANWGMISTVHLDDSVYVNPGQLMDPNFEFVMSSMSTVKMENERDNEMCNEIAQKVKQRELYSKSDSVRVGKSGSKSQPRTPARVIPVPIKPENSTSCVYTIPKEQLIVDANVKRKMLDRFQKPSFRCNFMLPLISEILIGPDQRNDATNELQLKNDLPDESDTSNSNSALEIVHSHSGALSPDLSLLRRKVVHCVPITLIGDEEVDDAESHDQSTSHNNRPNRNLFEQFQTKI